jgi:hypothetical protein
MCWGAALRNDGKLMAFAEESLCYRLFKSMKSFLTTKIRSRIHDTII